MRKITLISAAVLFAVLSWTAPTFGAESTIARYKAEIGTVVHGLKWHNVKDKQQADDGNLTFLVSSHIVGVRVKRPYQWSGWAPITSKFVYAIVAGSGGSKEGANLRNAIASWIAVIGDKSPTVGTYKGTVGNWIWSVEFTEASEGTLSILLSP
ncbi:MAG: hypothetical protein ABSA31_08570 [Acidimicrobiales bacterium]|jgi:hypothetical protein